ncbi:MAG: hypothetical protein ACLT3H_12575 [Roseburia sp.]
MTEYESFLDNVTEENIQVIENYDLSGTNLKGLYCDGVVALGDNLETQAEKKCVLAEELGHHYTATGDILDQSTVSNRKQEMRGRIMAYNKLVGLRGIVDAYLHHCESLSESAEYLDVTEEFLIDSLCYYKNKYGICAQIDNYVIMFEPSIAILELV